MYQSLFTVLRLDHKPKRFFTKKGKKLVDARIKKKLKQRSDYIKAFKNRKKK